ncbi:hypothetical protein [Rufibacter sp. XAAS-G3-1]|uniref:hypothetical protein n=1 Tax=Rufibacter sp. XAAS-G3-1 TaxID=2729134 RepID=UPI0015E7118C|nr:hypothetical protein [Rufibacter sp. XAAS-G3-1]
MEYLYDLLLEYIKIHPIQLRAFIILLVVLAIVIERKFRSTKKRRREDPTLSRASKSAKVNVSNSSANVIQKETAQVNPNSSPVSKLDAPKPVFLKSEPIPVARVQAPAVARVQTKTISAQPQEPKTMPIKLESRGVVDIPLAETKVKTKPKENLPEARKETEKILHETLFVNYECNRQESLESFPVFRYPQKGCVVRTFRDGATKRRGHKEEQFEKALKRFFEGKYTVSGKIRLNTGKNTRPYEPDIAIIDSKSGKNIRIDIEIDEPYAGITRQPTHCKGDDTMRDNYFVERGWAVIRFSEYQVHTNELGCIKFIAQVINSFDQSFSIPSTLDSSNTLVPENIWDTVQAQAWEKEKYREKYLGCNFTELPDQPETLARDFNEQELKEESLVAPTLTGKAIVEKALGFNAQNIHSRDKRIKFYPKEHIYTIDQVPFPSASTLISKFFPEFDSYGAARKLSPSNPLYGLPVEQIVQIWNDRSTEAANKGTFLHEQIEKFYLKQSYTKTEDFHLFEQFVTDHSYLEPYRSEWRIFDDNFHIAGTIDLIVKNGHQFDIYDWKRSKKVIDPYRGTPIVRDNWGKCGVGKLSCIDDTSYNRYCLQQSLYRYILEKHYDIRVGKMFLVVLCPDYDKYYKVEVPYQEKHINHILHTL